MASKITSIFSLRNKPNDKGLWAGIAGNHQHLGQIIAEFIDNSISNIRRFAKSHKLSRKIVVRIEKCPNGRIAVSVADGGTGIRDLENAVTLAGTASKESPINEHGFGLKHALASADKDNANWSITTRTAEDAALNRTKRIAAPYSSSGMHGSFAEGNGGIDSDTGTGTIISVICRENLLSRVFKHIRKRSFQDCMKAIAEELSFTYAPILAAGEVSITLVCKDENGSFSMNLDPLFPEWNEDSKKSIGPVKVSLLGAKGSSADSKVNLCCTYGKICPTKKNVKYYKCNMESSGVEIRINGRAITHGQLTEIWGLAVHPSWNDFCAIVDLQSDNAAALPPTKSAKNGLREDDERTEALYTWIRTFIELPPKKETQETHLINKLAEIKRLLGGVLVEREALASRLLGINVRIDMVVTDTDGMHIYESKLRRSKAIDVYQLRMYWDLAVADGKAVSDGVLVACRHPKETLRMVEFVNTLTDPAGHQYKLRTSTWREEGLAFDESVPSAYSV